MPTDPQERIAELEAKLPDAIKAAHAASGARADLTPEQMEEMASFVRQILLTITGDISAADLRFYAELRDLAIFIRNAKAEIAEIKPKDISTSHIPRATDELDAVVGATEEATNKIMDVCDRISSIASTTTPEIGEQLTACTTSIFEACNFQDITGQRITKVVQTLKYIDAKVEALLKALGEEIHHTEGLPDPNVDPEKALLNGPQLPQNAIDQSEIDRLLGGF